MRVWFDIR